MAMKHCTSPVLRNNHRLVFPTKEEELPFRWMQRYRCTVEAEL